MKIRIVFLVLFFFLIRISFAQQKNTALPAYSHYIMDSLTSDAFAGRGYVENGMNRTANFLANEFQNLGLQKIENTYFQEFYLSINSIKKANLKLNGKELKYGIDFLVSPNSTSQVHFSKEIYKFSPEDFMLAFATENDLIAFIEKDMRFQDGKHIVFPPYTFQVDSLQAYYKSWSNFYRPEENSDRAMFFFTNEKLIASLSQKQDEISKFIISSEHYNDELTIDNYLVESEFHEKFLAKNVLAKIEGKNKDSLIVLTAHYDHLGKVGETVFYGASDNASGVALLMELAKYYSQNQPKYTLVFIAFAAEEAGLLGADYFVENPLIDLSKVKFLLNFDIVGAGEEGIQIVNSSIFTKEYDLLNKINNQKNYLKQIKKRGEACNSDHCPFYLKGIPSFFIYTLGGPGHYHDPLDDFQSLNFIGFNPLRNLIIDFLEKY